MKFTEGERMEGAAGSAVEIIPDGEYEVPDWAATVRVYFLTCPGQSPAWSHYLLSIIHLRPIEGVKPADIRVQDATHEVMVVALDPSQQPAATDSDTWTLLRPINLAEQVQLDGDGQARGLLHDAAQAVVDGRLWAEPPLSGQVEPWRSALFTESANLRGGQPG